MRNFMNFPGAVYNPKYSPERRGDATPMMVLRSGGTEFSTFGNIASYLRADDLLVMNASATLPASLPACVLRTGERFELRLAARGKDVSHWTAISFGAGGWRLPTETRGAAPILNPGDRLRFGANLFARITSKKSSRLIEVEFEGEDVLAQIYDVGRMVQYAYHQKDLPIWIMQSMVGSVPLSVEPPSALFPLTGERLQDLGRKFQIVSLLHGAGISSTGEESLDALLPLPEPYEIPSQTMEAVKSCRGRVIAFGTTVARALEAAFESGHASGMATLRLGEERPARVVQGLLTGFHDPGTSHFQLECGFVEKERVQNAFFEAKGRGFRGHEFGDLVLLFR